MDKIIDNLYLGDIQGASNLFMLKRIVNIIVHNIIIGYHTYFTSSCWFPTILPRGNKLHGIIVFL